MASRGTLHLLVMLYSLCCLVKVITGACPSNCKDGQTCDEADSGCPECNQVYYGRQCEYRTECRYTDKGTEYRGLRNITAKNTTCQRWDSQSPHTHSRTNEEENYCRNPDNSAEPWCYTTDPGIRYEYCGIPKCSDQCKLPTLLIYGDVINPPSKGFAVGFVVEEISGACGIGRKGERICNGTWSSPFNCTDVPWCSKPTLTGKRYLADPKNDYSYNTSINIQCVDGYEIIGSPQITCKEDKTWTDIPQCTRVSCKDPVLNDKSSIRKEDKRHNYVYENEITVYCDIGYETLQQTSFICQANRQWNGTMPNCTVIYCEDPKLNNNSVINNEQQFYVYQTIINIACVSGYILTGENTTSCQANKAWSIEFPTCIPVPCETPALPANSTNILGNVSFVFQDTVTIECTKGMSIKTNDVITCLANRTWGTIPECTTVVCEAPTLPPNGRIIAGKSVTYQYLDSVTLGCDDGYTYEGLGTAVCLDTGLWEETKSNCAAAKSLVGVAVGATVSGLCVIVIGIVIALIIVRRRGRRGEKYRQNTRENTVKTSSDVEERDESPERNSTQNTNTNAANMVTNSEREDTPGGYLNMENTREDDVYQNMSQDDVYQNMSEPSRTISIADLTDFVSLRMAGRSFFENEFSDLPKDLQREASEACKQKNRAKNKYKNMYPYDDNRIKLRKKPGDPESDFINASPIRGYDREITYIAAQGPTQVTLEDFWRMVWEQNSGLIVMLTNPTEEGRLKCVEYWPEDKEMKTGNITIELIDTKEYADFIVRQLSVSKGDSKRSLFQYHYTAWPDKGVPNCASSLAHFRRKIINMPSISDADGPTIVHCSAGIGRTGTFIAFDYLVREAEATGSVNVFKCVQRLREQRVNMVQTKDQYEFLYRMVVEEYEFEKSVLDASEFMERYTKLNTRNPSTGKTYMQGEFDVLMKTVTVLVQDFNDGKLPENKAKNRYTNVLPADSYRPYLIGDGREGHSYINAVYLPSYRNKKAYLVTQMPLPNTVADFLTLVYEQNVSVIVMLNTTDDRSCGIYWPKDAKGKVHFGPIDISLLQVEQSENMITRTLRLEKKKSEGRTIKMYQVIDWPENKFVPNAESLLGIINKVEAAIQDQQGNPVVVHCMNGADKSGLFCTVMAIFDRLLAEQDVAIVPIIKQMRSRRPQIIPNMEQFTFCHEIVYQRLLGSGDIYSNFEVK